MLLKALPFLHGHFPAFINRRRFSAIIMPPNDVLHPNLPSSIRHHRTQLAAPWILFPQKAQKTQKVSTTAWGAEGGWCGFGNTHRRSAEWGVGQPKCGTARLVKELKSPLKYRIALKRMTPMSANS
jgi:hypothetical protein